MTNTDFRKLNYPEDAAGVRDLIREMFQTQVDYGSSMDTGGGMGGADLWVTFGGQEFFVHVKPLRKELTPEVG